MEDWKIKIAMLWLIKEATILVSMMLSLYDPSVMEHIIAGEGWRHASDSRTVAGIRNHIIGAVGHVFPVLYFEGFPESVDKHHRRHNLYCS